jgi:lysozyme family protein
MEYPKLFLSCLDVVLKNEGGYSNHPLDNGHATMKGVTQAVYDSYRAKNGDPFNAVIDITEEEIYEIYYTLYWQPMNIDRILEADLVLHTFDHGVNAGVRTSIKLLQRLIGVTDDGFIGSDSLRAVREFNGNIVEEFIKRRKLFYITLVQKKPELRVFMRGWLSRIEKTHFNQ